MNEGLDSFLRGTAALHVLLALALVLTVVRPWVKRGTEDRERLAHLLMVGIAAQCFHAIEELLAGFNVRFPGVFGLSPWSLELWVTFNVVWIAIWIVAALGILRGVRAALFPIWFFGLAMAANGIGHPLLSLVDGGYFPGLWTSPIVGWLGFRLVSRLTEATRPESSTHTV